MPPPAAPLENKHEGEMQEPPPVPAGTVDMADAANAMEAFLSTPLSLEAVSLLFTSVEVGTLFGLLDAEQSTAQLASDCVRRAFNHEVGMDVLESLNESLVRNSFIVLPQSKHQAATQI